jgi:hypothetical protein
MGIKVVAAHPVIRRHVRSVEDWGGWVSELTYRFDSRRQLRQWQAIYALTEWAQRATRKPTARYALQMSA